MSRRFAQSRLIWEPIAPEFTNIEILRRAINRAHPELQLKNYNDLFEYSVRDYRFWLDLWEHLGVVYSVPPTKIIENEKSESPVWFPGARLNYAENLLRFNNDSVACTVTGETGTVIDYTFRMLRKEVAIMAAALRANGLTAEDRVAAVVSNSLTAIVIALATASIGGIYSTTAPDMGAKGILDRYTQIQPKFLFIETEVVYAGKTISLLSKVSEVVGALSRLGLKQAVLLPSRLSGYEIVSDIPTTVSLSAFLASGDGGPLVFAQLPFNHPLCILFSSGTTGAPKCIVHSAGGILIQTMKDVGYCYGVGSTDTLLQYTTAGWMMWNLQMGALAWGARIVIYDGSPMHPDVKTFLRLVNDQHVSVLGIGPRLLSAYQAQGLDIARIGKFEALRSIASGGAVLTADVHEWVQTAFGKNTRVMTGMGGTDICSAFLTSVLSLPIYAGEISCKAIGMKVEVFDTAGNNIEHTGEPGEMVCTRPHPSTPLFFWGDVSGKKLHETYYSTYPGVWKQSDFLVVNPETGGMMILGRSDGVLNPNGVRFGSGEIYSVLEKSFLQTIEDSVCVGQRRPQDLHERVLLFVKMRPGHKLSSALDRQLRDAIKASLSSRHVPSYIFEVPDIPYTGNGKKIEVAVKQIVSGNAIKVSGAVANPESLQEFHKYSRLEELVSKAKL